MRPIEPQKFDGGDARKYLDTTLPSDVNAKFGLYFCTHGLQFRIKAHAPNSEHVRGLTRLIEYSLYDRRKCSVVRLWTVRHILGDDSILVQRFYPFDGLHDWREPESYDEFARELFQAVTRTVRSLEHAA